MSPTLQSAREVDRFFAPLRWALVAVFLLLVAFEVADRSPSPLPQSQPYVRHAKPGRSAP